jgi:GT2 family glycosyltransferase
VATHRRAPDDARVTALLVSHDGERWLAATLDALSRQTRPVDRVVAVDTGSADASPALLRERLGADAVVGVPASTGYGAAVVAGLAAVPGSVADEWVWLLHDDSAPAPDALEQLLAVATTEPVSVLGPKLREWPSLRRLLEVGVTISGTGRRETGLEPGEYDQGQHDRVRDVLAVNTAGMLVRRSVLESLGFDPRLPVFGNDLDLGWRAARAGHRTVVVPAAVVFHGEAAHRGVRRTPLTGRARRGERTAALYILLVNGPAPSLPVRVVRLFLGGVLRALGLLLVRAPGEAADELAAIAATCLRPLRIWSGRRARRSPAGRHPVPHRGVRPLLAPVWLPYRHGLDAVGDLGTALVHEAADRAAARRVRAAERSGTGPVPPGVPTAPEGPGLPARLLGSPVAWVLWLLLVTALAADRGLVGPGTLSGGALLPAPDSALDWWRTYLSSWHSIGTGSSAPAAPYLLPMAMAGTVLLGKASLVVDLLFLLAVPMAAWGGYRFLAMVTSSRGVSVWGAAAYGLLPVVTGAVQDGRLGTVAATVVLPWLAHAAVFLRAEESADRRARAAWRSALWLAVLTAFVPVAWALAVAVGLVALAGGLVTLVVGRGERRGRRRPELGRSVLTPLVAVLVLLLPWSVATWTHQGLPSVLFEAGLPVPPAGQLTRWDVLLGRPGAGAPGWLSLGVVVAALVALVRTDTRRAVLRAWVVVVVATAATALLARASFPTAASAAEQPVWAGFPLVVAQAAAITAAALAGAGIRRRLTGTSFGWRQPVGVLVAGLAVVTPVLSAAWWVWAGSAGPLDRGPASDVPTYMSDAALDDPANGVLVVRGSSARGFSYVLLRQPGLRLGDDSVLPSRAAQARLTSYVADLVSSPAQSDITALSRSGVAYVYAPAPADASLAGNLDTVSGVSPGSASGHGDRAWQLEAAPSRAGLHEARDDFRPWLLAVQGLAVVAVLVLAAPSRRTRR